MFLSFLFRLHERCGRRLPYPNLLRPEQDVLQGVDGLLVLQQDEVRAQVGLVEHDQQPGQQGPQEHQQVSSRAPGGEPGQGLGLGHL